MERSLTREVLLGTGAALAATKVMDRVTTAYHERQSETSKRRERELQEEPAYTVAAEKLGEIQGKRLDQEEAERLGQRLHLGLGVSGGVIAGFLAARGMNPVGAGILTGLGIWLVVDEGANAVLGITPPAPAYPRETHVRGSSDIWPTGERSGPCSGWAACCSPGKRRPRTRLALHLPRPALPSWAVRRKNQLRPATEGEDMTAEPMGGMAAQTTAYAGFWRRVAAYLIDGIILSIVLVPLALFFRDPQQQASVSSPISTLVSWLYFAFMESSDRQATFGKMALGIVVTDLEGKKIGFGRATGRYFARLLSFLILLIGVIMVAFTAKKQGLHDMIAGTLVVKKAA